MKAATQVCKRGTSIGSYPAVFLYWRMRLPHTQCHPAATAGDKSKSGDKDKTESECHVG